MTAYGPRAIARKIRYSDITVTSTNAQTFDITIPPSFWIDQCFIVPVTDFAASTSVTSVNVKVGTTGNDDIFYTSTDCKALTTPSRIAAASLTEDTTTILNGQGMVDRDNEGTVRATVTPTWSGTLTAGEFDIVLLGYQLPYPV